MKINKNKAAGLLLTGVMAASMITPALAADITMDGSAKGYDAYKLMNLTTSLKDPTCHAEGNHLADGSCFNYSYTVNEVYRSALKAGLEAAKKDADTDGDGNVSDLEIVAATSELTSDQARTFADAVYESVKDKTADKHTENKTIADAEQGYYLIVESDLEGDPDSRSLVMLDTAGQENITVKSKEGVATLVKKIKVGENLVDAVDVNEGDEVEYVLTGTLPENLDGYKAYSYTFHDVIDEGLEIVDGSVSVKVDGIDRTSDFDIDVDGSADGCGLEVSATDARNAGGEFTGALAGATGSSSIEVSYKTTLTGNYTTVKTGNTNTARVEFANDPYDSSSTSVTPSDKVSVFTYEVVVNKTDKNGVALPGAGFEVINLDTNKTLTPSKNDDGTVFTFRGLDAGHYKLVETAIPDGYNKADDVEFEIVSDYDTESDAPVVKGLSVKQGDEIVSEGEDALFRVTLNDGTVATDVINVTGIRLPGTGGTGTYLLYGGGAAFILAGGVAIAAAMKKKKETETEAAE